MDETNEKPEQKMRLTEAKGSNTGRVYKWESGEERGIGLPQEDLQETKKPAGMWLGRRSEMAFPNKSLLTNGNPLEKNFQKLLLSCLKINKQDISPI